MGDRNCEVCDIKMYQIPHVASFKHQGQAVSKASNEYEYQCINENCNKYKDIVTYAIG